MAQDGRRDGGGLWHCFVRKFLRLLCRPPPTLKEQGTTLCTVYSVSRKRAAPLLQGKRAPAGKCP